MSRYLVGIDLGTTHTVVAYADTTVAPGLTQLLAIDQLIAPGEVAPRLLLPSIRYHPAAGQLAHSDLQLPWAAPSQDAPRAVFGELARELGSKVPGRLVASAKSWLSHPAVDRTAPVLPWGAAAEVPRISPLEASASYLAYVRSAWNHHFPDFPLERQEIVLTVPASFDEVARRLTVEAAERAGLPDAHLLEEPQAACYDWLARHRQDLAETLADRRLLLVCDIGGGTTDLTLIRVRWVEGRPSLIRIGVGEHLMLGGDNMDLALAHLAETRITASGSKLGTGELSQLVQQCRRAKEHLLAPQAPESATVTLLGAGARLIGAARSTELGREEVRRLVVDGFLPRAAPGDRPQSRRGGIVEFGLPYAADPAVTRHLASFLATHGRVCREALGERAPPEGSLAVPDAVLLNGGVFRSEGLAQRLLEVLAQWRGERPRLLRNEHPELAVARGAVAYGMARRGQGLRIGGGAARSFVLRLEDNPEHPEHGVCLLPRGAEEGQEQRLSGRVFSLRLGQPVRFHLLAASGDWTCSPGELVQIAKGRFHALPPLATVLGTPGTDRGEVPVELVAKLTEVGTLEIHCVASTGTPAARGRRWQLEFQLRGQEGAATASAGRELHPRLAQASAALDHLFGARASDVDPRQVKRLQADLERLLGPRETWDTPLLRELFASLWAGARRRRRSAAHERLWFNLVGYCLRPGYGYPLDDWRVQQLWSLYPHGVQYTPEARNWAEWWTLWRRVAGGLDEPSQIELVDAVGDALLLASTRRSGKGRPQGYDDMVRMVGGLERLPPARKVEIGEWLADPRRSPTDSPQRWWALGRLGARVPFYGSAHAVVPSETARAWLERVLALDWRAATQAAFAATQIARLSGDRERDLEPAARQRVAERLRKERAPAAWVRMVEELVELDAADQTCVFGESLPPGLRLVH